MADNELMKANEKLAGKLDDIEKSFKESIEKRASAEDVATLTADLDQHKKDLQGIAETAKRIEAQPKTLNEVHRALGEAVVKAQSEGTDASGGYLVEDEIQTQIRSVQNTYGAVRRIWGDQIIPMPSDVTKVPVDTYEGTAGSDPVPVAVSENAQLTEDAATIGQITLTAQKYGGIVYVSQELFDDSFVDVLGAWLLPKIGRQSAKKQDDVVFNTASTGLLKSSSIQTVTMASGDGAFTDISYEYLLDLQDAVVTEALAMGKYHGHRSILSALRKLRAGTAAVGDGGGQFLDGSLVTQTANGPDVAFYPWDSVEKMPAASATAVSTAFVLFGDLPAAMLVGERGGQRIETSRDFKFDYDQIAVRYIERYAYATDANIGRAACKLTTNAAT